MKNTKNKCIVKIKKDRICNRCGKKLKAGTECMTVNPKFGKRYWICTSHLEENNQKRKNMESKINTECCPCYNDVLRLKTALENDYDFDDEGKYYAFSDALSELQEHNCWDCKRNCNLKEDEED